MERLPLELSVLILLSIDDFSTLFNFIRTFSSIYNAFRSAKPLVLSSALKRCLDIKPLHKALAVQSSALLPRHDYAKVVEFVNSQWLNEALCFYPLPTSIRFNDLARIQTVVEWFTDD